MSRKPWLTARWFLRSLLMWAAWNELTDKVIPCKKPGACMAMIRHGSHLIVEWFPQEGRRIVSLIPSGSQWFAECVGEPSCSGLLRPSAAHVHHVWSGAIIGNPKRLNMWISCIVWYHQFMINMDIWNRSGPESTWFLVVVQQALLPSLYQSPNLLLNNINKQSQANQGVSCHFWPLRTGRGGCLY